MRRPAKPAPPPTDPRDAARAAYTLALRWLSMRETSAARIRSKLADRGFEPGTIEPVVERLTASKFIDDERAVRACARTLIAVRLRGRQRARRELEAMGFAPALVRRALDETVSEDDERALAARVLKSRLRGARVISDPAAYRRIYGALLRRGFSQTIVRDVLKPVWKRGAAPAESEDGD